MHRGATTTFDPLAHHRERTRKAEARAETLEQLNAQLVRLLALSLEIAVAGRDVCPLALLSVVEDLDAAA